MKRVEEALGRVIDDRFYHSVPSLNDVQPSMVEDLRRLVSTPRLINPYLRFHVVRYQLNQYEDFVRDVVVGGIAPSAWGFRDVLVQLDEPNRTFCLGLDWRQVLDRMAPIEGDRWWRAMVRSAPSVNLSWSGWGAIGVRIDHVPYWWRHPPGTHAAPCSDEEGVCIEHIDERDAPVALRRWIASRIWWWAEAYLREAGRDANEDGVLAALAPEPGSLSADARIALRALLRECASGFDPARDACGFVGPDDWYTTG
jgi:hypothetical protein